MFRYVINSELLLKFAPQLSRDPTSPRLRRKLQYHTSICHEATVPTLRLSTGHITSEPVLCSWRTWEIAVSLISRGRELKRNHWSPKETDSMSICATSTAATATILETPTKMNRNVTWCSEPTYIHLPSRGEHSSRVSVLAVREHLGMNAHVSCA